MDWIGETEGEGGKDNGHGGEEKTEGQDGKN